MHLRQGLVFFTFLLSFLLFTQESSAQINNNRFRVDLISQDMGPCGGSNDSSSVLIVTAKSNTVNNFEVVFDLPDGVFYNPGTATITNQQGSSDFILTEADISNLNEPRFRLERPGDANWQIADRVRFRFERTANCESVVYSYSGGLFKDAHTIFYNDQNGPQSDSDSDPTINSYNLRRAYLAVTNYSNVQGSVGEIINRPLEISNSGNGVVRNFEHNVVVDGGLGNYSLNFNGTPLVPSTVSGNTFTYSFDLSAAPFAGNVGNGDGIFENETIPLVETFEVLNCGPRTVAHQPTWGCSALEVCQLLEPVTTDVVLNTNLPRIEVSQTINPTNTDLCQPTRYGATISNNSASAPAYDVVVNFGFSRGGATLTDPTQNALWGNDAPENTMSIIDFRIDGNSFNPDILPNTQAAGVGYGSYVISNTLFTSDPDGPGGFEDLDGDGFYDDLAAGESSQLTFDYNNLTRSGVCGADFYAYLRDFRIFTDVYAYSQCGDLTPTDRANLGNSVLYRREPTILSPTDVFEGTPFTVSIEPDLDAAGTDRPQCNGIDLFTNDPNSSWTITLTVPTGVTLSGAPAGYTQTDPNTIVYTTTNLIGGNRLRMNVDFPLEINCSVYSGPLEIPISYTTRYECSCFSEEVYCGTIEGIRAQCANSCTGSRISSFEAQRSTAGWTDQSMTTKVVLDPNIHNLETYMARDEMVVRTSAVMENFNPENLWFDLTYSTEDSNAGGADIIQFQNGTITINDLSSGTQSTTISVTPTLITDGPNDYRMRFDLSGYTDIISPTYTYGEPSGGGSPEADEVELELQFAFNDNFNHRNIYELSNFSGEFFNNDVSGNKVPGCTVLGDRAYYLKNRVDPYQSQGLSAAGCEIFDLRVQLAIQTVGGDQFPNEFRPPALFQSLELEIPPGMEYLGTYTSGFPGGPSSTNGGLSVVQSGSRVTISPGVNFQNFDQDFDRYPDIRIEARGSSSLAESSNIIWDYRYTDFAYSDTPDNILDSDVRPFAFTPPVYTITSPEPVISGDRARATYEVDLCMDSQTDIDFNWLQVANGTDFTVVNAYEVNGITRTPLIVVSGSGLTWIEAGSLAAGAPTCKKIEFEIDFTNCSAFEFEVQQAWECAGYPSDFTTATYRNPLTLRLEPKEAVLQMAILNQPAGPVDVCSSFDLDIEIRNAGAGDLIDPILTFDIPGDATSLSLDQIAIEYPQGSGDVQNVSYSLTGNTVSISLIEHTGIGANTGIEGSINAANINAQIAEIQLDLSVQCNFTSNTAITYTASGNNPCSSPATGSGSRLSTNPIVVSGAVPTYDAVSTLTVPNGNTFSGCTTETISIESVVVGGPTGTTDFARIILPDGLTYETGSFVATSTFQAAFNSLTVVGNHEEILLDMPSGVNNGELITYTLNVRPKDEEGVCSPNSRIEVQNFVTVNSLSCNGVSCGTAEIPTGDTFEDVIIQKAEIAQSALSATATYNFDQNSGSYDYTVDFGIENTGVIDLASGFTYDVFCSDGSGGKLGASIHTGTINQAITAGTSITESVTFTAGTFCGNQTSLILELVPSATNCHCETLSFEVSVSDPTPPVLSNCPADINIDASDPLSCGAIVSWTPPTATDNSGTVVLSTNNYNPGDAFLPGTTEVIYTATDPSGNATSCSFFVTVTDAIPPEITGPGDQLLFTDLGSCETTFTYNLTPGDNCIMSTGQYPVETDFEVASQNDLAAECWGFVGSTITTDNPLDGATSLYTAEIEPAFTRTIISPLTYLNGTGQIEFIHQLQSFPSDITTLVVSLEDEALNTTAIYSYTYVDLSIQSVAIPITQTGNYRVRIDFDTDTKRNTSKRARLDNLLIPGTKISDPNLGCASPSLEIVQTGGLPSGSSFPVGVTTNTFEVVDAYGNIGTYSFNVEVEDNENPTASNPAPLSFNCPSEVPAPDPEVVIDEADNCTPNPAVAFVSETASGANPMILTRVYSISDDAGNSIQVQQEITIMDNEAPVPIVNPLPDLMVECGEDIVTFPEATDNCVGTVIGTTNDPLTYAEEGNYTITWTYDDGNGNTSEQTQNVIVTCTVDVSVSKTANLMQVALGDNLTFTITAENLSTLEATNIEIEDLLDPSFEFAFASATHGNYDETTGIWQISLLNPGEIATLDITVVVLDADGTTNVAEMALVDQVDFNPSNDRSEVTISVIFSECLTVYNEFSPNGDGLNEVFFIECIEQYPNNNLKVYNRWGNLVYEMDGYDNSWDGISMGRATISQNEKLPVGTYYYILEPNDGQTPVQTGWLYITR